MAESHEHHAKDAKNEEKKDDKKEEKKDMKKLIKKEVQTHGEPVHEHKHGEPAHEHKHEEPAHEHKHGEPVHEHKHGEPAHEHKHGEPAHEHKHGEPAHEHKHGEPVHEHKHGEPVHEHKHGEPAHEHKHGEPAHEHKHGEPAHEHKHGEPAHEHKHGEPVHEHEHGEPVHEHKHGEPAHEHEHKPVEAVKKIEAPAPKKPVAAPSGRTAKDLADEIDKELSAGQFKAVEGDKGAKGAEKATGPTEVPAPGSRHPVPDRKAEPEVEIIEEEPETKKEEKGDKAEEGPKESTKEEAKEKKKGKKGGKLKGRKKKKKEYRAQPKPEISADVIKAMQLRRVLKDKTPNFIRQEAYNYGRLGQNWRKPRGKHSKLRHHISYRINVASIGYGGPNAAKGLHPSGFREVLVHHPLDLDGVDPKKEAARVAHGVGKNKRRMIQMRAERMGIRILNEIDTS
jgi:large subunit ribosomal protein L32e